MLKFRGGLCNALIGGLLMTAHSQIYVAPNGNDSHAGTLRSPFATLTRARDAVREIKKQEGGKLEKPIRIFLRGGTYHLTSPFTLTPEDSGAEDAPIYYVAYRNEKPVISGGVRITGWKTGTLNGKKVWQADLPELKNGSWTFRQLWVNGKRRFAARHPNKGYLEVEAVPDVKPDTPWHEGQKRLQYKVADLKPETDVSEATCVVMTRWVESHLPIIHRDNKRHILTFAKRSVFQLQPGDLYYLIGAKAFLDAPGEWWLDEKSGTLYYLPHPGEKMNQVEIIAPRLSQLIRMEGKPETGRFVEHICFEDITFAHTEWQLPDKVTGNWPSTDIGGFPQAAVGVPATLYGEGVRSCLLLRCTVRNTGNYGIELGRGCSRNSIQKCLLTDLGAGGIKIGETTIRSKPEEQTFENEVEDCKIHDGGRIFHSAIGIWIGQSYKNRLMRNHIHDFYYTGISIGWTWGYGEALGYANLVEENHVHHIGVRSDGDGPILSDMGGIYTLGNQQGTVIRNNKWHDIAGLRYGGWGIYFDEGTTGAVAENNLVYRTTHGGFHQHYGKENIVRNNIFAYARDWQIQRTRPEEHRSFTFERNIVLFDKGMLLGGHLNDTNYAFDYNLYWHTGKQEIKFMNWTLEEWQARGMDRNSLIADPMFVNPKKDDFRLQPNSPAFKLGFVEWSR